MDWFKHLEPVFRPLIQIFESKNPLENNTLLVVFTFETNDKEFAAKGLICFERTTSVVDHKFASLLAAGSQSEL